MYFCLAQTNERKGVAAWGEAETTLHVFDRSRVV